MNDNTVPVTEKSFALDVIQNAPMKNENLHAYLINHVGEIIDNSFFVPEALNEMEQTLIDLEHDIRVLQVAIIEVKKLLP